MLLKLEQRDVKNLLRLSHKSQTQLFLFICPRNALENLTTLIISIKLTYNQSKITYAAINLAEMGIFRFMNIKRLHS